MAAARIKSGTAVATGSGTTVTLDAAYQRVEILNRDGSIEMYVTTDGSAPTVNGDNCYVVTAMSSLQIPTSSGSTVTAIRILAASGTPAYSVTGLLAHELNRSM